MELEHAEFTLSMPGGWVKAEGEEQLCFEWAEQKASLVISVMAAAVAEGKLEATGRAMMLARRHAEEELTPGVQFDEVRAGGDSSLAQVLSGSTNPATGLVSRSLAMVTRKKIVSVWIGCELGAERANALMNSVIAALQVKIP
ncbi:MAG: hypothetical protein QM817_12505 [Archangium sp.]